MDRAVFDRDEVIERLGHDGRLARELLETFLAESPGMQAELQAALEAGDTVGVERLAHGWRGALASVSAGAAAAAARALELRARERDREACRAAAEALSTEIARLERALSAYLGGAT